MSKEKKHRRYSITFSNRYKRNIKHLVKSGQKLTELEKIIDTIAQGEKLPQRCMDHELKGALKGIR